MGGEKGADTAWKDTPVCHTVLEGHLEYKMEDLCPAVDLAYWSAYLWGTALSLLLTTFIFVL